MMKKTTIVFWSCAGADASELSFGTAELLAEHRKTLIAELPCLGIPRLGFAAGIMDRSRNTESALMRFDQKNSLNWDILHQVSQNFAVLPASVFATPDCPIVTKVSFSTLMEFIAALQELAWARGCDYLVLDCQGQLISPMTFFSLKAADQVVIPLAKPTEAAYALASIRRLIQVYKHSAEKFILAAVGDIRSIERIVYAKGRENENLKGIKITSWDSRKVKGVLDRHLPFGNEDSQEEEAGVAPVGRERAGGKRAPGGKEAAEAGSAVGTAPFFNFEQEVPWGALLNEEVSSWELRQERPPVRAGAGLSVSL
jgi:MinD-like ATPase involved in chromosome partitioning or flagellar assembly